MIVTLYKTAADGRLHYYTIHDRQQLLDSPFALIASWRIGMGREREKLHCCGSTGERDRLVRSLIKRRTRDGYKILYSFSRAGFAEDTVPLLDIASC